MFNNVRSTIPGDPDTGTALDDTCPGKGRQADSGPSWDLETGAVF